MVTSPPADMHLYLVHLTFSSIPPLGFLAITPQQLRRSSRARSRRLRYQEPNNFDPLRCRGYLLVTRPSILHAEEH